MAREHGSASLSCSWHRNASREVCHNFRPALSNIKFNPYDYRSFILIVHTHHIFCNLWIGYWDADGQLFWKTNKQKWVLKMKFTWYLQISERSLVCECKNKLVFYFLLFVAAIIYRFWLHHHAHGIHHVFLHAPFNLRYHWVKTLNPFHPEIFHNKQNMDHHWLFIH